MTQLNLSWDVQNSFNSRLSRKHGELFLCKLASLANTHSLEKLSFPLAFTFMKDKGTMLLRGKLVLPEELCLDVQGAA